MRRFFVRRRQPELSLITSVAINTPSLNNSPNTDIGTTFFIILAATQPAIAMQSIEKSTNMMGPRVPLSDVNQFGQLSHSSDETDQPIDLSKPASTAEKFAKTKVIIPSAAESKIISYVNERQLNKNMLPSGGKSSSFPSNTSSTSVTENATEFASPNNSPFNVPVNGGTPAKNIKLSNSYISTEGQSVCTICMKRFSKPSQLRLHINIHFLESPFRCESCSVGFRTEIQLRKHSRSSVHFLRLNMNNTLGIKSSNDPRPFKCDDCKTAFSIHGHLAKHLRSKSHIMKLECSLKLPFGMLAKIERNNISLASINTTDSEKALKSLKLLANEIFDSPKIEEDIDDDDLINDQDEDMSDVSVPFVSLDESPKTKPENLPKVINRHSPSSPTEPSQSVSTSASETIASIRSNACPICGRTFQVDKKLQVHLYQEHPEDVD